MSVRKSLFGAVAISILFTVVPLAHAVTADQPATTRDRPPTPPEGPPGPSQPPAPAMPSAPAAAPASPSQAATPAGQPGILDVARQSGQFTTLLTTVDAAGLTEALSGPGPFTLFAPTDAAFAALPAGVLDDLLKPENRPRLATLLRYHVLPRAVGSSALAGRQAVVETAAGRTVAIDGRNGVEVNGAGVVQADVEAGNGVIHVIDAVLMPPADPR